MSNLSVFVWVLWLFALWWLYVAGRDYSSPTSPRYRNGSALFLALVAAGELAGVGYLLLQALTPMALGLLAVFSVTWLLWVQEASAGSSKEVLHIDQNNSSKAGQNIPIDRITEHPSNLQALIAEITQLTDPNDMPKRIKLCQQALKSIMPEKNPEVWATLQSTLGVSFFKNPHGDPSENLEQAINHYKEALKVITRETMPEGWAEVMNNMAVAYADRIQGDRAKNLEQAIVYYKQALEVRTRAAMPVRWADTKHNLAGAYVKRIREDRAENIEQAIGHLQEALEVRTRTRMPREWAKTMWGLGTAYRHRIQGEGAANLKQAILYYEQSLEIITEKTMPTEWSQIKQELGDIYTEYTHLLRNQQPASNYSGESFEAAPAARLGRPDFSMDLSAELRFILLELSQPAHPDNIPKRIELCHRALELVSRDQNDLLWAVIQTELGNSYQENLRDDRARNFEQAIAHYQKALEVITREVMPDDWAMTVDSLATAYANRIQGDRAKNLDRAIDYYRQALEVRSRESMPIDWATTMMNLASAYIDRILGERAENIEIAIDYYNQVLEVRTHEAMPVEWANTVVNLANAYEVRIQDDRAKNIEIAIEHYERALEVVDRETTPIQWARTMMNLALAYENRIRGDRAENIEQAIDCYQSARRIVSRETMPVEWARIMMNLANAYIDRIRSERSDNIEQAINYSQQALEILTREAMPAIWAGIMHNMALAYAQRVRGDPAKNFKQAVDYYQQALEVRSLEVPADYRHTQSNLGHLYFSKQHWVEAVRAYETAIEAGQLLLEAAYTETGRRAEVAETSRLYANAAYCQIQQGRAAIALLTLEAGKTHILNEAMALSDVELSILPDEKQQAVQAARETIRLLDAEVRLPPDTPARRDDRELAEALRQARADLNHLIAAIRAEEPNFMPTGLDLTGILALIPPGGALVAPLVTSQGSAVFVLRHGATTVEAENVIPLDDFTDGDLNALLVGSEDKPGWLRAYQVFRNSKTRATFEAWQLAIETFTGQLWDALMGPVYDRLVALGLAQDAPVLLMPQGGLGLLPVHAAWREVDGKQRTFLHDYTVTYAPSGYALSVSHRRLQDQRRHRTSLLAVVNPTGDLIFTPFEGEAVAALFDPAAQTLVEKKATRETLIQATPKHTYLHFSCHGFYDWQEAMRSGLLLAGSNNGDPLTLADIISKLDLATARLVTLSACETGLTDISQSPDEYIGLPAGFLQAGAPGVVSTLWAVADLSTALLMERFYCNHLKGKMGLAAALREAQLWVRDMSIKEAAEYAEKCYQRSQDNAALLDFVKRYRYQVEQNPTTRPFEHPYYWAAFTMNGV
ncbi:MAG: CHAT domain-containing protein [Anaerolineae bacterium]|nr:CHAT domain-containing protein [Anaerolineae bacterium]